MNNLQLITTDTPDGQFHMITDEQDVVRLSGFGPVSELKKRLPQELIGLPIQLVKQHTYQDCIRAYFKGDHTALTTIPGRQTGSDFQMRIWKIISAIPYGHTISYTQLAEQAGSPAAVRAAGTMCGKNRLILLVPCHRVLKSDGSSGSYLYGVHLKESLLNREQTHLTIPSAKPY